MLQDWKRENCSTEETENYWCHCWPCCWSKSNRNWKRSGRTKKTESRVRKWSCTHEVRDFLDESIKSEKSKLVKNLWNEIDSNKWTIIQEGKKETGILKFLWVCDKQT